MTFGLYSTEFHIKRDEIRLRQLKDEPIDLLEKPTLMCFGALQDTRYPLRGAKQSAKTTCRISGITGKSGIPVYTVVYNIDETAAKRKSKRNNDPITTTPYDENAYDFARDVLLAGTESWNDKTDIPKLQKRFSNLVISSFSYGGMASAEVLNACYTILNERGFSKEEASSVMACVKHISIADPTDLSFYASGATCYRVLNQSDMVIAKYSSNHEYVEDWLKNARVKPSQDVHFVDSAHYPRQHMVMLKRNTGTAPYNVIADMEGNFTDIRNKDPFIRHYEPTHHNSTSYYRHALSRSGFLGPAIIQNLHLNALQHAVASTASDAVLPMPDFETMVAPPTEISFSQDLTSKRSLWANTDTLVPQDEFRSRIKNAFHHLHRR